MMKVRDGEELILGHARRMPNGRVHKEAFGNADEGVVLAISPVVSAIGGRRLDGSFREATRS